MNRFHKTASLSGLLFLSACSEFVDVDVSQTWQKTETQANNVLLAMNQFVLVNSRPPASLDELVPAYLKSVHKLEHIKEPLINYYPEQQSIEIRFASQQRILIWSLNRPAICLAAC
ncbi:MAG: hypothetical protein R3F41_18245 [Gammaproteobacteria bacterium]|nr:hypothetical protein [Pseudomonadales bacterium]